LQQRQIDGAAMQRKYYPFLDGIRAVCVVLTLIAHARGAPRFLNGTVGVDIFFALSGYLITMLLIREAEDNGQFSLSSFYIRRIFRIVPLYYITILLYLPATLVAYFVNRDAEGINNFFGAAPWLFTFNSEFRQTGGNLLGHAWTLGIEEKFYIFWPLILPIVIAMGRRAIFFLPFILVFFPSTLMFRGYVGIVSGATLALLVERGYWRSILTKVPPSIWLGLIALAYVATFAIADKRMNVLVSISAAFLISSLIQNPEARLSKFLSLPPLPFLGTLTYAMYLLHRLTGHVVEEILDRLHVKSFIIETSAIYLITILAAYVLHRLVEKPMIRIGKRIADTRGARRTSAPEKASS
jgi:peptidoglycan/LPS O-acetylase OafA/YrhL